MGNWPSISLVLRRIAPALKTAWLGSRLTVDLLEPVGGDDPAQLAQRPGRDVRLELAADPALQLGPLHREPVGVGGDHRHLLAGGADQDAGQHRAHVVARGGAGDQVDGLGQRRRPGSSAARRPLLGKLREVLGRQDAQVEAASRRCGSRRRAPPRAARSRPRRRRASGRARRAGGRGGGPSRRSATSASSSVRRPISPSVAPARRRLSAALRRIPERAWVAARVETARETIESLETSSSRLVVSFK